MTQRSILLLFIVILVGCARPIATAPTLTLVDAGPWTGEEADTWRSRALDQFTRETGVRVQLVYWSRDRPLDFVARSLESSPADVYSVDVVWPGVLAEHLLDLNRYLGQDARDHFPAIVENYVVNGKLVAMPSYTDAGLLFYRTDLLREHGYSAPPATWEELETMSNAIQAKERAKGRPFWGFVWQGADYEGLMCNALEWQASQGGGRIVETDGTITIKNPHAARALERAAGWIGSISPPGILSFKEVESESVWLSGRAAFIRNWPGTWTMSQASGRSWSVGPSPVPPRSRARATASSPGNMRTSCTRSWRVRRRRRRRSPSSRGRSSSSPGSRRSRGPPPSIPPLCPTRCPRRSGWRR
jgi:ABC-type glycerol-3-phosphate transport system substrate-binding protein